jgi:predicted nucleotidyltransferase
MRFADLVAGVVRDADLLDEINRLLAVKMASGEDGHGPRLTRIQHYIETQLASAAIPADYKRPAGDTGALDAFLMEVVLAWKETRN